MRDENEGTFDRWLLPILLGLSLWGWASGIGFILLTGASDSYHGLADLLISFFLSLWILGTTDPKTWRQLVLVVVIGAGVIVVTVSAVIFLSIVVDYTGIREAGLLVGSGVRALGAVLCFATGIYGNKWITQRLGVPLRTP